MENPALFDPFTQNFTLQDVAGEAFNVSLSDLDSYRLFSSQECIAMGVQIGACAILLVVLLLLTKPGKRMSAIFILNSMALVFDIIRCVLEAIYWTGPFVSSYAYLGQDYSLVPSEAYAQQVTGTVCTLLLQICVEISLCIQTHVVCINFRRIHRQAILAVSILIALSAIAVRFLLMVENDIYIVQLSELSGLEKLVSAANITTTICIGWFCLIFVGKLGFALHERKKLGIEQFGPMQIIFIMGCQTLLIPVIFCIMNFYVGASIGSFVLTTVALTLPLSSLWASASLDGRFRQSKQNNFSPQMIDSHGSRSTGPMIRHKNMNDLDSPAFTTDTHITSSLSSPGRFDPNRGVGDLEAQGLAGTGDFARKDLG